MTAEEFIAKHPLETFPDSGLTEGEFATVVSVTLAVAQRFWKSELVWRNDEISERRTKAVSMAAAAESAIALIDHGIESERLLTIEVDDILDAVMEEVGYSV